MCACAFVCVIRVVKMISTVHCITDCIAYSSHGHTPIVIFSFQLVLHTYTMHVRIDKTENGKKKQQHVIAFVNVMNISIQVQQPLSAEAEQFK